MESSNYGPLSNKDHDGTRRRRRRKRDPKNERKWEDLKKFIWNTKTKEILGRDFSSWGRVIFFFVAFYASLLTLLLICMLFFSLALDEISPTMRGLSSCLQEIPGLAYRPVPDFETNLIRFIQGQPSTYKPYTDHIQAFLDQYENEKQVGENFIDCEKGRPPGEEGKVCRFHVDDLGDMCTWQRDFGYDEGQPCVLLKLNKIFDWMPVMYEDENSTEIPDILLPRFHPDHIGVTCEGRYPLDNENIGNISYNPPQGFSRFFYPYQNQEGYRSPLVMIQFLNPMNGILINVMCKAWAKNISPRHHINDQLGLVTFSLLVD